MTSNWCRCTSCHAGYGWKDHSFDFNNAEKIDCLICHDTTGKYKKFPTACGYPPYERKVFAGKKVFEPVNLQMVAQNVGPTSRASCGKCHFYSGGGDGVKRGDLDSTLSNPEKNLDVHMDAKGLNFSCSTCHTAIEHEIDGRKYRNPPEGKEQLALPKDDGHRIRCASCHGLNPHKKEKLNHHTDKVACQSCHVPYYARSMPTNIFWDWSTAGEFGPDHKPIVKKDKFGKPAYHTKKGTMAWDKDVVPEYFWFNGTMQHTVVTDKKEPQNNRIWLNKPLGEPGDPKSKIYPFKVHLGKQPYDPENKTMVIPKLFGKKGSGAFWAEYDWLKAAEAGMKEAGVPFSGKLEFVETLYYLPLSHMIPPKEKSLDCQECHRRQAGRLAAVKGVYIPGRDLSNLVDKAGWLLCGLTLLLVIGHGLLRIVLARKK